MHALIKAGLATGALAASLVVAAPANAATAHCSSTTYPNKVEVNGGSTVQTNLAPGTQVCIKVGTQTAIVTVRADGTIRNTTIKNKNGTAQGISYYAYGSTYTPPES